MYTYSSLFARIRDTMPVEEEYGIENVQRTRHAGEIPPMVWWNGHDRIGMSCHEMQLFVLSSHVMSCYVVTSSSCFHVITVCRMHMNDMYISV